MTFILHRRGLAATLAASLSVLAAPATFAQASADKAARIIVAGPPGGSLEVVSRLLADGLQKELGKPVIVETKAGGGGAVAVGDLTQSPHDGNTMLVSLDALVSEIPHVMKLRFDMAKEVKPLAELARGGLVMVGNPSVPARKLKEVIAYVKTQPGKVSYASYSAGTVSHVMGLQLNKAAGIDMLHVAYKGTPPALADLMGGHVPVHVRGDSERDPADQGRQDLALCSEPVPALAEPARRPDLCRARLPADRGDGLARAVRDAGVCRQRSRRACATRR